MPADWTPEEVHVIVTAYFEMLSKEQLGMPYKKSEVRRRILPLLNNRSEASIEFKNQNISGVLAKMGRPYIRGYLPAYNFQGVLFDIVSSYVDQKPEIETIFRHFAETEPTPKALVFDDMVETTPTKEPVLQEPEMVYRSPVKVNYLELEQANRAVGRVGEKVAIEYEKWRLMQAGKEGLADQIEWVSETKGDGLGFDILSRNTNGTDRYIEVKSTKLTKETPFYFTAREYHFAKHNSTNFFLYRVFNLTDRPKLFIANGPYDDFCNMSPTQFKATF